MTGNDNRGYVEPIAAAGDGFMDPMEPIGRTMRSSVLAVVALVAVVAAAVAGTVLWRNRNGDPFGSARSIPADMDFVLTIDILQLSDSAQIQDFVAAFAVPMADAGMIDSYPDDLVAAVDDVLSAETDFSLRTDVMPWLGRSVSLAGNFPDIDPMFVDVDLSGLLSIDVRDRDQAERFVDKVLGVMARNELTVTAASIGGLPGYSWEEADSAILFGLVLTDESMLVGVEKDVAAAIAARETGLSIADDATFRAVMDRLPGDRIMTTYLTADFLEGYANAFQYQLQGPADQEEPAAVWGDAIGASFSLTDEGVLAKYVMVGADIAAAPLVPDTDVLKTLPANTIGFVSVAAPVAETQQTIDEMLGEIGPMTDEISNEIGIDVGALLESLSGRVTIAVAETRDGLIATETDVPVAVVGALGLTDPAPLRELLDVITASAEDAGVVVNRDGGVTMFVEDGVELFGYSLDPDLFVIGTSDELVADISGAGSGGLLDTDLYRELDGLVIGDGLLAYTDIAAVVGLVPLTSDERAVFSPMRGVGYGALTSDGYVEVEVLVLVDY